MTPGFAHAHPILHLQRTLGNQAVPRLLQAKPDDLEARSSTKEVTRFAHDFSQIHVHTKSPASVQAKLTVSPPRDIYEQEADRASEQVMSMPEPQLQRVCACGGGCPKCQTEQSGQEHERLQTKRVQSSDLGQSAAPPTRGGCICVGAIKPPVPPVPVPERAEQGARVRVRVRAHPYFEDYANRLPYMEAPPGREFIVVIDDGIFKQVVAEAEALRIEQTKRLLRPADPRNLPFIQVEPVLIGGAVVAAFVAIPST